MASKAKRAKTGKPPRNEEPDYTHHVGDEVRLYPPEPLLHKCPDCMANEAEGLHNRRKASKRDIPMKVFRLTYVRCRHERWGTCVTRHDVYRCRACRGKFVSTNGREPQAAAHYM